MAELNDSFIEELLKASLTSKNTLEILIKHLEYGNLPTEGYKTIWKEIKTFYTLENKLPTIGILLQSVENGASKEIKPDCRHILAAIKGTEVTNVHDQLIKNFEDYKKEVEFVALYEEVREMYSTDKEKAIKKMAKESERISNFSLKDGFYDRVFADFNKRQTERKILNHENSNDRIPSGIHEFDFYVRGGFKKGTSFLALGRSGSGKSTYLRWVAVNAARLNYRVVLFSLEGLKKETMEALDSAWTSTPLEQMEFGVLEAHKVKSIEKAARDLISGGGEIYVHSSEGLEGMTIEQCNRTVYEIKKLYGEIDMILFDYLELFQLSGFEARDSSGERRRREQIANKITDMGVEHSCVTGTVTQATDILPAQYNKEDFVLTRSNISEFKGVLKPFSYFFTFNQTDDESDQKVVRIYTDKFRKHKSGQTIRLFQQMEINRFYDSKKTLKVLWDNKTNRKLMI